MLHQIHPPRAKRASVASPKILWEEDLHLQAPRKARQAPFERGVLIQKLHEIRAAGKRAAKAAAPALQSNLPQLFYSSLTFANEASRKRSRADEFDRNFGLAARIASVCCTAFVIGWLANASGYFGSDRDTVMMDMSAHAAPLSLNPIGRPPADSRLGASGEPDARIADAFEVAERGARPEPEEAVQNETTASTADDSGANMAPLEPGNPRWKHMDTMAPIIAMPILDDHIVTLANATSTVSAFFMAPVIPSPAPDDIRNGTISKAASGSYVTTAVRVRSGPASRTALVGVVPANASVQVLRCGKWCKIAWNGKQGYVFGRYVAR